MNCDTVNCQIKYLNIQAKIPTKGSQYSACYDLYSSHDDIVPAHSNKLIGTGIALSWDNPNFYVQILSRSGLAYKKNIVVQCGTIDQDYCLEIFVLLQNNSNQDFDIKQGDRIAQMAFLRRTDANFQIVEEFDQLDSNRIGGFGSTGGINLI